MDIFNVISILGGLAMFLYGMRMMGDGLKESSSGTLKKAMEKLTNTPLKAFFMGLVMTAVIQSSTATIVITSGLVGAGIISLVSPLVLSLVRMWVRQLPGDYPAFGFECVGDFFFTVFKTINAGASCIDCWYCFDYGKEKQWLRKSGRIVIGFGILFSGLMNMTDAVSGLAESGIIEQLFSSLGQNPFIGYLVGAGVAFVLQSSSATIGILQAFSTSGQLTFGSIYAVLVGIYLGDCVTTAIVCNIGAKPDAKRVGIVNILYNLGKSAAVLVVVTIIHKMGLLDGIWSSTIDSGGIANTNTILICCAQSILFPALKPFEKLSHKIVQGYACYGREIR